MQTINVEIPVNDVVRALVKDGSVFDAMPALKVGDTVVIDLSHFNHEEDLVFKTFFGSYKLIGRAIDTSNKNNKPELKLVRID